jgi:hypothetical protein
MEPFLAVVAFLAKSAVAFAVAYGCIRAIRWTAAVWAPLGYVLAFGILIRLWAGLALYVISFWNLPILRSLQLGDGFWFLALDARAYFISAAQAAGGRPIPPGSPSPSFVEALGWWLRVAGVVPVTAVLFNLALYVASCVMVIAVLRPVDNTPRRAALIVVASLSFSPVLILLSTQPLKDVFSTFLIVMAAAGLAPLLLTNRLVMLRWQTTLMVAGIALAIFLMAGVRTYYGLFMWGAVALALAAGVPFGPPRLRTRFAGFALIVLAILWLAFMRGAGPYYVIYGNLITQTLGVRLPFISPGAGSVAIVPDAEPGLGAATESIVMLRRGFARSGGGTNLTSEKMVGPGFLNAAIAVLTGLAAMFLPITVLKQLSIVQFSGGRGFLAVTDLDTVFLDCALIAVFWLLLTSGKRLTRQQVPYLLFSVGLALIAALPMAYIITNYGTLFRLRLLATIPLFLVPLAFRNLDSGAGSVVSQQVDRRAESPPSARRVAGTSGTT